MIRRAARFLGFLALACSAQAQAQAKAPASAPPAPPGAGLPVFVQLDGNIGLPLGGWAEHAAFPDATQFGLGSGGRLTLGWAPSNSPYFTAGVEVGFSQLGTSAYERFARGKGVPLAASARRWSAAAGGTVHLPGRGRSTFGLELHGALGLLVPSGEDRLAGKEYDYEFLQTTMAGWLGARGSLRISSSFDVWAGLDLMVAPGAVRYRVGPPLLGDGKKGDGQSRTATSLEPGVGIRTWFDL